MDQPILHGMEHSSPTICLKILRAFSETSNGEATVLLMLRHLAQMAGVKQAAILLPCSATNSTRVLVSIGGYELPPAALSTGAAGYKELPIIKDDQLLGFFSFTGAITPALLPGLEYLALALSKWNTEKIYQRELRRHERLAKLLKRQNSFLNSLYRISLDMVNQKDYGHLMNTILRHAQSIMQAKFASIYLLNEQLDVMEMKFVSSTVDNHLLGLSVRRGEGGAGHVWQTGKFLLIQDYPNWGNRIRLSWLDGIGTIAFVPLFYLNTLIGVICLGFTSVSRKVTVSEKALLQQFATLAAMVSENVRLLNVLVKRDEDFTQDIRLAAEVQQTFLPFNYNDHRLSIKAFFQPLHMVSGDLYNYFWSMKDDVIFGYVADVTGHGVTASLRTSAVSALFQEAASLSFPLVEKMKWVHGRSLGYFSEGAYFAAIGFELNLRCNELHVACGGLYEFFIKTPYYTGRIQMTGSLMGLQRTPVFEERTFPARAGDCFYFLSDGFTEQLESTEFPRSTFQETCNQLEEMCGSGIAWDDMAGLCIKLRAKQIGVHNDQPELQLHFVGFDEYHVARQQLTEFVEHNFPEVADDIILALHEAVGNALRHGSATRPVFVRIQKHQSYMSMRIKDSGRGFDSRTCLLKGLSSTEYDTDAISGRGVMIMRDCMDKVYYSSSGNEVLLLKKLRKHQ
ncbi:MAG TPA: ATP-binding protein [Negativicutes bacterium]|nr:ATP-binding protein [Negativicutes bacterium]